MLLFSVRLAIIIEHAKRKRKKSGGEDMKHFGKKVLAASVAMGAFLYWQNNAITMTQIVHTHKVPEAFHGYKILHISDLQNKLFGANQNTLIYKAECAAPDMIVITGDLIDRNRTDLDAAMDLIRGIVKLAPVYYVSGNHEHQSGEYDTLVELLVSEGVTVLDNGKSVIERGGETITLMGLADKSVNPYYSRVLDMLCKGNESTFTMLLSHRPELFEEYAAKGISLVFSGHAHGGQIRLPKIGGLFAPHQGFFPTYTSGAYTKDDTTMVVSRGLGNSTFPFRIFNRPELLVITLYHEKVNT